MSYGGDGYGGYPNSDGNYGRSNNMPYAAGGGPGGGRNQPAGKKHMLKLVILGDSG